MGLSIDKPFIFFYIKLRNLTKRCKQLTRNYQKKKMAVSDKKFGIEKDFEMDEYLKRSIVRRMMDYVHTFHKYFKNRPTSKYKKGVFADINENFTHCDNTGMIQYDYLLPRLLLRRLYGKILLIFLKTFYKYIKKHCVAFIFIPIYNVRQ